MKKYLQHSRLFKSIAVALVILQVFTAGAAELLAAGVSQAAKVLPAGPTANRTAPKVTPIAAYPTFSNPPRDLEIMRARVFEEPLISMGEPTPDENRALAEAIMTYL